MMLKDKWRIWDQYKQYGEVLFKRATGQSEEMESSKSLCKILQPHYRPGLKVLDVGCGAGHYLRSLRNRIDADIDYTGVDATRSYVELANKAFGGTAKFMVGDIFNLPFADASFDIVMCNNVILHLPPPPIRPLSELIRVSRQTTIVRTLFGKQTYVIKEIRTAQELPGLAEREGDLIQPDGEVAAFNYFNLYSERYMRDVLEKIAPSAHVTITADNDYKPFDNRTDCGSTATTVINGIQVSGNIIHDMRYIVVKK
jgi:ubiquinone/menaquinone biosynthesis C-methylase UbiE